MRDHYCSRALAFPRGAGWHLPWSWHRRGRQRLRPCCFVTTWDDRKLSAIKPVLIASSHGFYDWKAYGNCGSALPFRILPVAFLYVLWEGSGKLSFFLPHLGIRVCLLFFPLTFLVSFFLPCSASFPSLSIREGPALGNFMANPWYMWWKLNRLCCSLSPTFAVDISYTRVKWNLIFQLYKKQEIGVISKIKKHFSNLKCTLINTGAWHFLKCIWFH